MLTASRVLYCLGLICFVPFFYPTIRHENLPNGTEERFTLGLPQSPWFVYSHVEIKTETKTDGKQGGSSSQSSAMKFSTRWGVEFINWSWVFLGGGLALMAVSRRFKRQEVPKG